MFGIVASPSNINKIIYDASTQGIQEPVINVEYC